MSITKKDVEHIAYLARIHLSETEIEKYEKELSLTLHFVDKLAEVDTENVEPLTGGTELTNVMRNDIDNRQPTTNNQQLERAAELVKAAPEYENGYIKVKKVFE